MTDQALATRPANGSGAAALGMIEQVVIQGDLSKLTPQQRANYYGKVCESLGLNPYTRPFEYISLNNKLVLYARKDATDQLRALRKVNLGITSRETVGDLYVVTARATLPDGRADEEIGAVTIKGLMGEALANAMMKASTKAKRRVTLSIVGLGWLDESEVVTIPDAESVAVDQDGVILDPAAILREAVDLFNTLKAEGVDPESPASRDPVVLTEWLKVWKPRLEEKRAAAAAQQNDQPGAVPASAGTQGEAPAQPPAPVVTTPPPAHDDEPDAWDELTRDVPRAPKWTRSPHAAAISSLIDQLDAAGKRKSPPAPDADEATLLAWIDAAKGILKHTGGSK